VTDDHGEPDICYVQLVRRTWMRGKPVLMPQSGALTDGRGRFVITDVSQGRYFLQAEKREFSGLRQPVEVDRQGHPLNAHLVKTYLGDTTRPDSATSIQVQPGQSLNSADIQLRREPTFHIKGKIVSFPPGDSPLTAVPASAINVVLIPEKRTGDFSGGLKYASTDGQGKFTFNSVSPGKYKAFAADEIDDQQWMDPDVAAAFDSRAEALDLKEGDSKQIQLTLITAEEAAGIGSPGFVDQNRKCRPNCIWRIGT
jgi:hypothetical protein